MKARAKPRRSTRKEAVLFLARCRAALAEVERAIAEVAPGAARAAEHLARTAARGGKLLVFGNGGSAADASHFVAEVVGRYRKEAKGLPAVAFGSDPAITTALANDYGYDAAMARWVEALGARGDCAVGISTSGRSKSVVAALGAARRMGLSTIALTGRSPNPAAEAADLAVAVPIASTARIQEAHQLLLHEWAAAIEAVKR